jgi:hypothetical protein
MKFLDITGLQHFVGLLYNKFANKDTLNSYNAEIDPYMLDVDYSQIQFDKTEKPDEEGRGSWSS